jgi:hypothetical protein
VSPGQDFKVDLEARVSPREDFRVDLEARVSPAEHSKVDQRLARASDGICDFIVTGDAASALAKFPPYWLA